MIVGEIVFLGEFNLNLTSFQVSRPSHITLLGRDIIQTSTKYSKVNQNIFIFQAVDWWSVGVLTYELLTGASPFTVEGEKNTQQEISKRILKSEAPMPGFLSDDVKDFILKLLVKEPRKRLGGGLNDAEEVKGHRFFRTVNW